MTGSEMKPAAWIVIEQCCRAPDDCEDLEVLVSVEDIGHYQRHVDHGRAYPLYAEHLDVTLDQAKQVVEAAGLVVVPVEPTEKMIHWGWWPWVNTQVALGRTNAKQGYKAMIKASQEGGDV